MSTSSSESDPLDGLDNVDDLQMMRRSQCVRKPSAYVRNILQQGDLLPQGVQLPTGRNPYNTQNITSNSPTNNEKSEEDREVGKGVIAHGYAMMVTPDFTVP